MEPVYVCGNPRKHKSVCREKMHEPRMVHCYLPRVKVRFIKGCHSVNTPAIMFCTKKQFVFIFAFHCICPRCKACCLCTKNIVKNEGKLQATNTTCFPRRRDKTYVILGTVDGENNLLKEEGSFPAEESPCRRKSFHCMWHLALIFVD